jgi:hypothetical protein
MIRTPWSIRIGTRKPKAVVLSAIWRICFFEWVRALRALGLIASTAIHCIVTIGFSLSSGKQAERTGFGLRWLRTTLRF